jgi:hypothetical protein
MHGDNTVAHTYSHGDRNSYCYSATGNTYTNAYSNTDATTYCDSNTYGEFTSHITHASTQGDTKASSHSASSAVSES